MGRAAARPSKETNPQLRAAEAEEQALNAAMLLVFIEKRLTICFLCLGEQSLPFEKRTKSFASLGDLRGSDRVQGLSNGAIA